MTNVQPLQNVGRVGILHRLLEQARLQLVQTDGRNRLIHTPRDVARSKSLKIVDASSDEVFRLLLRDRTSLPFAPARDDTGEKRSFPDRKGATLQTVLTAEALQKRVLGLYRDAKTLEEEQGVNILYLAIGFLRWYESESSETAREAPLILVPVSLTRNNVRSSFRLQVSDEDIAINLPLQERLREFGISLPAIPDNDDWAPKDYFNEVGTAISAQTRWTIDEDGMLLGFFSFSKFLMFRDLDPANWPTDYLLNHPILAALLVDGFPHSEPLFPDEKFLDDMFDPGELIHVVDADASQAVAIETVRKERNLVIQGPPGTGKSQTITNIIAAAVHDGKRVLFVAEKMAALDVVHKRLLECGLGGACLELHSRHANKREVIRQIDQALRNNQSSERADTDIGRLRKLIGYLNNNAARLNTPIEPSGITPFKALGEQVLLLSEGYAAPIIAIPGIQDWAWPKTKEAIDSVERLSRIVSKCGSKLSHPWRGVNAWALQPAELMRLRNDLEVVEKSTTTIAKVSEEVANAFGLAGACTVGNIPTMVQMLQIIADRPKISSSMLESLATADDLQRLARTVTVGKKLLQIVRELDDAFSLEAWDTDFDDVRDALARGVNSWTNRLRKPYRRASRKLSSVLTIAIPKQASDRLRLVESFTRAQELRHYVNREDQYCREALGDSWKRLRTDFDALERGLIWINALTQLPTTPSLGKCVSFSGVTQKLVAAFREGAQKFSLDLGKLNILELDVKVAFDVPDIASLPVKVLVERLRDWLSHFSRIEEWIDLARADKIAYADGAGPIADALATEQLKPEQAVGELRFVRAEALWKVAITRDPQLAEINGEDRSRAVDAFKNLETARRSFVASQIQARHRASLPKSGQELQLIRHEIAKQRRHLATRQLVERAPSALRDIKPVFLMSPISVAQFLPPGRIEFDLLVMDEASQIRPEDALGAIARAKQVVIVGDKKQLPPTSFFDRILDDDDEDNDDEILDSEIRTTALESILSACEAQGMSSRMLT
jgi:hypothetical protein